MTSIESKGGGRKDYIRVKQTHAELRNKRRKVIGYLKRGEEVPQDLIMKIQDLNRRLER